MALSSIPTLQRRPPVREPEWAFRWSTVLLKILAVRLPFKASRIKAPSLPYSCRRQRENLPKQTYETAALPKGKEKIIFVDDEASIAEMGRQILERLGYAVTTCTGSRETLELFKDKPDEYDLVITDMTMPKLTGDKLAIELMKIRSDIPVILCSGYSKKINDETASEIGVKAFANKPILIADLAKTVRKVS